MWGVAAALHVDTIWLVRQLEYWWSKHLNFKPLENNTVNAEMKEMKKRANWAMKNFSSSDRDKSVK